MAATVDLPVEVRERKQIRQVLAVLGTAPKSPAGRSRSAGCSTRTRASMISRMLLTSRSSGPLALSVVDPVERDSHERVGALRRGSERNRDGVFRQRDLRVAGRYAHAVGAAEILAERLTERALEHHRHRPNGHAPLLVVLERPAEHESRLALRFDALHHPALDDASWRGAGRRPSTIPSGRSTAASPGTSRRAAGWHSVRSCRRTRT